jgi:hypothetical protein
MPSDAPRPRLHAVATVGADPVDPAQPTGASALQFSETVRQVVALARRHRLRVPVFRSPPGLEGVDRSIRRRPNGTVVVAVRRTGRPLAAVQADVIEGVVAANRLTGAPADRFRHAGWDRLSGASGPVAPRTTRTRPTDNVKQVA